MSVSSSRFVLDTNIVLDCFVFDDPMTRDLLTALESHHIQALAHDLALDELQRVLAYPQFYLAAAEQGLVLARYRAVATLVPMPNGFSRETPLLPAGFPRCRDGDDEPFLALAYHARAEGLVTKDKAVLQLRTKARQFGVTILAPTDLPLFLAL